MSPPHADLAGLVPAISLFDRVGCRALGCRVAPVSRDDLFDFVVRRIELETNALARSIERGGHEWEGDVLKSHHQASRLSREVAVGARMLDATWEQRHRALHFSLLESCGSPWLLRLCG
jgi:GntR family transcriptional regulator, carbon starvation induced regulator